ncbi:MULTISPECIES: Bug family tripartite tricarboxylate transporter substrate binding protein [Variovorax]|uniref:Bug family tripartite tricarboxylate transporter substrate binding protein n=1 Tax=Variovorax TaxID=34072 RepID=UPI00086891B8|nr:MULTISPECIES: tripartite tricarboxylate transporter substrate binding protein [Variovorax]MBN8753226.1 tripartite tricarboxylate transporter substrate binding protein [Variovorax sp.]ODU11504.1 MAG: ABC transporter substrate-binding protein [Variovorax sp. SCN 67-85]ODV27309.1 MAG: ABC transporter substrate-binding protein [Variovorax sp. SCN 67-20]OJZ11968.1 MAG: ABC transporter substrate-binding protein [Variovorax sp. 67-131]UKI05424.1 tripartite tricarboxylate transporter substrate bind
MKRFPLTVLTTALALAPLLGHAQAFPEKAITFVVPFAAGTATDQIARALGNQIATETKQAVIIDNKAGASGFIASQNVAKAPADGYTVLITTNTTHAANEHLFKKLPYDPVKDFSPVAALGKGGQIMVVNPSFPAKNVAEFIALAKKEPGKYSFGSGSSSSRMAGELLQQMADIKLLHVPYKSNTLAVTDLLGGQINMMITDTATGLPQVKAGKLRALGFSSSARSPLAPDVPTISEAGVKGYEMGYWFAAYAPAKTPPAVVKRLNELLVKAAKSEAAKTAFYEPTGTEVFTTTPEDLAKFQAAESQKWGRIVKAAGIEAE